MKKYLSATPNEWGVSTYLSEPVLNIDLMAMKLSVWLTSIDYEPTDYEVFRKGVALEIKVPSISQELIDDPILVLADHPVLNIFGWVSPAYPHYYDCITCSIVDTRTVEFMWEAVKLERAKRLLASDWTQLPDVPLATKEAWAAYRQALRDITLQSDPFNITWPVAPA